jgi:hypothetical protein
MELQEQYIEDFATGFNDAAVLACHAPEILSEIVQDNNPQTDYFEGFFAGKEYYHEQEIQKGLESFSALRSELMDRDNELERE